MFDIEQVLNNLEAYFKANLNGRITDINNEKNDSITLQTLDAEAFILGDQDTKNKSYDPYLLIELTNVTSEINGPITADTYEIMIVMFLQDDYNQINSWKTVLRYWRAIKETASLSWDKVARGMRADIRSLTPVDYRASKDANPMKAFGVSIEFTIT